jgi:hypothetical protein
MATSFISLGDHCSVGFAIRKFFKEQPGSPFDWLITPTNALIDILNTNGEKFGLSISYAMNGHSIMCESYGCLYHHEFSRNAKDHCIVTVDDLKNCREKLLHKYKKMINLCQPEKNPVFIRYIHPSCYPENGDTFIYTKDTIFKIHEALKYSIGHDQFNLLFVTVEKTLFQDNLIEPCELMSEGKIECIKYTGDYTEQDIDDFWGGIFTSNMKA